MGEEQNIPGDKKEDPAGKKLEPVSGSLSPPHFPEDTHAPEKSESINMEVHHKHHHDPPGKKEKPWKHYLIEFLMLFLAITAGFFAENEREHYIEGRRAKEYAAMLKDDLIKDTDKLQSYIDMHRGILGSDEVKQKGDIISKSKDLITIGELRKLGRIVYLVLPYRPHDATVTQLRSSGNLRYFKDTGLIRKLAIYDWEMKRYIENKNLQVSVYGGVNSEHMLRYRIRLEDFLNRNEHLNSEDIAKKSGYGFESWDEYNLITTEVLQYMDFEYETEIPLLIKAAGEIIKVLNEIYHLK